MLHIYMHVHYYIILVLLTRGSRMLGILLRYLTILQRPKLPEPPVQDSSQGLAHWVATRAVNISQMKVALQRKEALKFEHATWKRPLGPASCYKAYQGPNCNVMVWLKGKLTAFYSGFVVMWHVYVCLSQAIAVPHILCKKNTQVKYKVLDT